MDAYLFITIFQLSIFDTQTKSSSENLFSSIFLNNFLVLVAVKP